MKFVYFLTDKSCSKIWEAHFNEDCSLTQITSPLSMILTMRICRYCTARHTGYYAMSVPNRLESILSSWEKVVNIHFVKNILNYTAYWKLSLRWPIYGRETNQTATNSINDYITLLETKTRAVYFINVNLTTAYLERYLNFPVHLL